MLSNFEHFVALWAPFEQYFTKKSAIIEFDSYLDGLNIRVGVRFKIDWYYTIILYIFYPPFVTSNTLTTCRIVLRKIDCKVNDFSKTGKIDTFTKI